MRNMIIVLLLLIGGNAYAQQAQATLKPVGNEPLLKENIVLTELAIKVNEAKTETVLTGSSREVAIKANINLMNACDAYRAELKNQIEMSTDQQLTDALNRELRAVNALAPIGATVQPKE